MSDDIKELVKALRAQGKKNYGLYAEVADALEALVKERDRLKAEVERLPNEKVAGGPRPEAMGGTPPATDPVYTGGMNDLCVTIPHLSEREKALFVAALKGDAGPTTPPATDPEVVCDTLVCIWGSNLTQRRSGLHDVSWVRCDGSHVQYYADNAPCSVCGRRVKIAGGG